MSLSPKTYRACPGNRLAIERKQPKAASLVPAWSNGFTRESGAHQERAQKWAEGFRRRCALETELIRDVELARHSNEGLAKAFGVDVITARRARIALENRGMIPRVMVRHCQDGSVKDVSRLVFRTGHKGRPGKQI